MTSRLSAWAACPALACVLLGSLPDAAPAAEPAAEDDERAARRRVVVLAIGGLDFDTVQELLEAGDLPHLAALREAGTFAPLVPAVGVDEPVAWTAFRTGREPRDVGVPGFVRRTFSSYQGQPIPGFGHIAQEPWRPAPADGEEQPAAFAIPRWTSRCDAPSVWDHAARSGVRSIVLGLGQPDREPPSPGVRLLAGEDTPDARGGFGDWWIYTDDPAVRPGPEGERSPTAGHLMRVDWEDGAIAAQLPGPVDHALVAQLDVALERLGDELDAPELTYRDSIRLREREQELRDMRRAAGRERVVADLVLRRDGEGARVAIGGREQLLRPGQWSDWYTPSFELAAGLRVDAITRVKLLSLDEPHLRLLVARLDIDPASPPAWQPISSPPGFAAELVEASGGRFETYGWPILSMPFKDSQIDAQTLLEDVEFTFGWRERLLRTCLGRDDWELLVGTFQAPDRVQHALYQYRDPQHPLHDPGRASAEVRVFGDEVALRDAIPAVYRRVDRLVGEVAAQLRDGDVLLVVSPFGGESFRRQVHLNNWLHERGYLVLKEGLERGVELVLDRYVDWSRTRAYALGLGHVYLNLEGREPEGIVSREEAPELLDAITRDFLALVDPETDARVGLELYRADELDDDGPDLVAGFAPGYRVAWRTSGGGITFADAADGSLVPGPVFADNTSPWSGGHPSVALGAVRGVLLCNRPAELEGDAHLLQVAPTVLAALGVPVPDALERGAIGLR